MLFTKRIGPQNVLITGLLHRGLDAPKGHWHIENGHQKVLDKNHQR